MADLQAWHIDIEPICVPKLDDDRCVVLPNKAVIFNHFIRYVFF